MRIAIFSDNFYPELSGIADSVLMTGTALAERGHMVDYYVPAYSKENFKKIHQEPHELMLHPNITITRLGSLPFPTGTHQGRLVIPTGLRWMLWQKRKPDIIHTQLFFGVGLEALATARMLHVPLVGTNHTSIGTFVKPTTPGSAAIAHALWSYAVWYYRHCSYVTAPSQFVFDTMAEHKFNGPHEVLSNPIDTEHFTHGIGARTGNVVAFAGRLAMEKNIDVIVRAIAIAQKEIPTIRFVLAGHGPAKDELQALADKLGVGTHIEFRGTLDQAAMAAFYQSSDVFAISSTSETQSMVLMQALACGLPAIGVRAGALPQYILPSVGFVTEPGDAEAFAKYIVTLLRKAELRTTMGRAAEESSKQYAITAIANRWETLYQSLL